MPLKFAPQIPVPTATNYWGVKVVGNPRVYLSPLHASYTAPTFKVSLSRAGGSTTYPNGSWALDELRVVTATYSQMAPPAWVQTSNATSCSVINATGGIPYDPANVLQGYSPYGVYIMTVQPTATARPPPPALMPANSSSTNSSATSMTSNSSTTSNSSSIVTKDNSTSSTRAPPMGNGPMGMGLALLEQIRIEFDIVSQFEKAPGGKIHPVIGDSLDDCEIIK